MGQRQRQRAAGEGQTGGPAAVPITRRALLQRVDRRLRQDGRRLVVRRSGAYVIDGQRVVGSRVDPVGLARSLGVMQPWEQVAEDGEGGGR